MRQVVILGAGGMGTALALLLERSVGSISIWSRDPGRAERFATTRINERHLPGVRIPDSIRVTADIGEAAWGAELIVAATPTAFLRATLESTAGALPAGVPVLSVVKGIEIGTFARPSQILGEVLGDREVAVLSGPSHAEELARGQPASVLVTAPRAWLAERVRDLLNRESLRVYTSGDPLGVELAGALKNVLGVAAGICDGLGFGDNAKAALVTRGLVEITRLGVELGARPETFQGLAGVGDVVATCYSRHGRNRMVGERIGRGESLEQVLAGMVDVAEGVATTRAIHPLAEKLGLSMPITAQLHQVLFEGKPPRAAVIDLMVRAPKVEWDP